AVDRAGTKLFAGFTTNSSDFPTRSSLKSSSASVNPAESGGNDSVRLVVIIIVTKPCPPISLFPDAPKLPDGSVQLSDRSVGVENFRSIDASGGQKPYKFFWIGSGFPAAMLPPGLTLSPLGDSSVILAGKPTTPGTYKF